MAELPDTLVTYLVNRDLARAGKVRMVRGDTVYTVTAEHDPENAAERCEGCGEPRNNGKAHGYSSEFGGCV